MSAQDPDIRAAMKERYCEKDWDAETRAVLFHAGSNPPPDTSAYQGASHPFRFKQMKDESVMFMKLVERQVNDYSDEKVIIEYVKFTKEFREIKEYVLQKGKSIVLYSEGKEAVTVRVEDILYFESSPGTCIRVPER